MILVYFELNAVINHDYSSVSTGYTAFLLLLSGFVAFLLNLSVFFAIKSTSALTYTVMGNLKVVIIICLSVLIFQNEVISFRPIFKIFPLSFLIFWVHT